MKTWYRSLFALMLLCAFASLVSAGDAKEVTLSGTMLCAKCALKEPDFKECQNVLVVEGDHAGQYYLAKNEVADKIGHLCGGKKLTATVTGTLEQKDGKTWITAAKIDTPKEG